MKAGKRIIFFVILLITLPASGFAEQKTNYYTNGNLWSEESYNEAGELHGVCRVYYKNGSLRSDLNYRNGKRDGINKWYLQSGKLKHLAAYRDGKVLTEKTYGTGWGVKQKGKNLLLKRAIADLEKLLAGEMSMDKFEKKWGWQKEKMQR